MPGFSTARMCVASTLRTGSGRGPVQRARSIKSSAAAIAAAGVVQLAEVTSGEKAERYKALAKDLCLELIARSTSPNPEDSPLSTTGSYFSLLYDILSSGTYESVKTTAHFHLTETDDVWHIQSDESLENEIVGGFISYLRILTL